MNLNGFIDNDIRPAAEEILREVEEYGEDLFDLIHQTADSHSFVIYYGKAWELTATVRIEDPRLWDEVLDRMLELEISSHDPQTLATHFAYNAVVVLLETACQELGDLQ